MAMNGDNMGEVERFKFSGYVLNKDGFREDMKPRIKYE